MNQNRIIIVDDEPDALLSMSLTLSMAGITNVETFSDGIVALSKIDSDEVDIALLDLMMPSLNGMELLKRIKEKDPECLVIMATGVQDISTAVDCIRNGALDYLLKPIDSERLIATVKNAIHLKELQLENKNLVHQLLASCEDDTVVYEGIISQSDCMRKIFKYIEAIAPTRYPVLITGETGTGKELIARALHKRSSCTGKFVAVNVAGIDDTVFTDTLFGHRKGAFTGADTLRPGLIEQAVDGTLFLDEIGDLSSQSQTKLLRLIQEKEYLPLGADTPSLCKARIVTATCQEIDNLQKSNLFRKDLYFRLKTHHIALPPLRKRKEDLQLLVTGFVKKAALELGRTMPFIPSELHTLLGMYDFPGNIRELEAMVFDAVSIQKGNTLSMSSFKEKMGIIPSNTESATQHDELQKENKVKFNTQLPSLREIEDMLIDEALNRTNGNQSLAAEILGITRQALGKRLKSRYCILPE
jgi:DNA-binding NtrC family response regulator